MDDSTAERDRTSPGKTGMVGPVITLSLMLLAPSDVMVALFDIATPVALPVTT